MKIFSRDRFFLRIIGLEETASSCQSILEPSFNNQVKANKQTNKVQQPGDFLILVEGGLGLLVRWIDCGFGLVWVVGLG